MMRKRQRLLNLQSASAHVLLRLLGSASYRAAVYVYVYRGSFQPGARWGEGGRELTRDPSPVLNLFRAHHVHERDRIVRAGVWSS